MIIYQLIDVIFKVINLTLFARILLSWIPHNPYNPIIEVIYNISEPILSPFRNILPPEKLGGLDISPIFAFFVIDFVRGLLFSLL